MNDKEIDKKVEEMMRAIAEALIESRSKYVDMLLEDSIQSTKCNVKKGNMSGSREVHYTGGRKNHRKSLKVLIKRAGVMVAVLVLTMGLFLSVSEAARQYLYNAIFEEEKDHYVVVFGPDDKEAPVYKEFVATYIPEGFENVYHESSYIKERGGARLYEEYTSSDGALNIEIVPRESIQITIDSEDKTKKRVEFDGIEGYYFYSDTYAILLWSDGRYEFKLSGNLSLDDYIAVSKGIKGLE